MGLFDRFKRRVKEVADEVDTESLTVTEDSNEAKELIAAQQEHLQTEIAQPEVSKSTNESIVTDDDDWEVFDDDPVSDMTSEDSDDDWEVLDEDDDYIPQQLSRKEKKRLLREQKQAEKAKKAYEKSMKKRGATEVA